MKDSFRAAIRAHCSLKLLLELLTFNDLGHGMLDVLKDWNQSVITIFILVLRRLTREHYSTIRY